MAEGNGLLNRHTSQGYRGFESLRLRQSLKLPPKRSRTPYDSLGLKYTIQISGLIGFPTSV